jgi:hypothetical protein
MERRSITRSVVVIALLTGVVRAGAGAAWHDAPEYVRLFAPVNHRDVYSASVSSAGLDRVLADIRDDSALGGGAPGAWEARRESPQDAFGTTGPYNRWSLARAYGSAQPQVARGTRIERGRIVEAWTLISPYPSADLRTLHSGTLRLMLDVAP